MAREQVELNQDLLGLVEGKEYGMFASMPERITSVMRLASTLRGIPPTKAIINPWDIREVQPQVRPASSTEVPQTSPRRRRGSFLWKT